MKHIDYYNIIIQPIIYLLSITFYFKDICTFNKGHNFQSYFKQFLDNL